MGKGESFLQPHRVALWSNDVAIASSSRCSIFVAVLLVAFLLVVVVR